MSDVDTMLIIWYSMPAILVILDDYKIQKADLSPLIYLASMSMTLMTFVFMNKNLPLSIFLGSVISGCCVWQLWLFLLQREANPIKYLMCYLSLFNVFWQILLPIYSSEQNTALIWLALYCYFCNLLLVLPISVIYGAFLLLKKCHKEFKRRILYNVFWFIIAVYFLFILWVAIVFWTDLQ